MERRCSGKVMVVVNEWCGKVGLLGVSRGLEGLGLGDGAGFGAPLLIGWNSFGKECW